MNFLLLLFLVFFAPLLLLAAWLAASSCLGNRFRHRWGASGLGAYGQSYLQTMAYTGPAMSEQIEMSEMLDEPGTRQQFEEDD
ncbi:hypothetical protein N7470_008504 [Penicillium chermesinum]|nr:hypothetical protein N7470_008504 [Penicillium chermesinum]